MSVLPSRRALNALEMFASPDWMMMTMMMMIRMQWALPVALRILTRRHNGAEIVAVLEEKPTFSGSSGKKNLVLFARLLLMGLFFHRKR